MAKRLWNDAPTTESLWLGQHCFFSKLDFGSTGILTQSNPQRRGFWDLTATCSGRRSAQTPPPLAPRRAVQGWWCCASLSVTCTVPSPFHPLIWILVVFSVLCEAVQHLNPNSGALRCCGAHKAQAITCTAGGNRDHSVPLQRDTVNIHREVVPRAVLFDSATAPPECVSTPMLGDSHYDAVIVKGQKPHERPSPGTSRKSPRGGCERAERHHLTFQEPSVTPEVQGGERRVTWKVQSPAHRCLCLNSPGGGAMLTCGGTGALGGGGK